MVRCSLLRYIWSFFQREGYREEKTRSNDRDLDYDYYRMEDTRNYRQVNTHSVANYPANTRYHTYISPGAPSNYCNISSNHANGRQDLYTQGSSSNIGCVNQTRYKEPMQERKNHTLPTSQPHNPANWFFSKIRIKLYKIKDEIELLEKSLTPNKTKAAKKPIKSKIINLKNKEKKETWNVINKTVKRNNAKFTTDFIIDLHGLRLEEAEIFFPSYLAKQRQRLIKTQHPTMTIKVITGKGTNREKEPVLKGYVKEYLEKKKIKNCLREDGGSYLIKISRSY